MAIKRSTQIEFNQFATVADMIEACEDLRATVGPDAQVHVLCAVELDARGPRVRAVSARKASSRESASA